MQLYQCEDTRIPLVITMYADSPNRQHAEPKTPRLKATLSATCVFHLAPCISYCDLFNVVGSDRNYY